MFTVGAPNPDYRNVTIPAGEGFTAVIKEPAGAINILLVSSA